MPIVRRLLALALSLLILMMTAAQAEVSFLVQSNGWTMENAPVEVLLKADVDTHMPFDEDRLVMLTPVTGILSLRLVTGDDEGLVSIAIAGNEALTLQYRGNEVQLSNVPDVTYLAVDDPLSVLLGTEVASDGGYEVIGLAPDGESLLTDGRTLLERFPAVFEANGKRTKSTTNISGIGRASYRIDYTFAAEELDALQESLLSICPDGWLHEIINGLLFDGPQKVRMYFSSENSLMRMEYNGVCGPEEDLRTVKLIYKMRHDEELCRDYIELTSPAKKGKDKNTLTFERSVQTNKKGARVMEGSFNYTVVADGVTSVRKGEFDLINACTDVSDVISGEVTIQTKLNDAEKYDVITLAPNLTISGASDAPVIAGTLGITEKYASKVTESAVVSIDLKPADALVWTERPQKVDLSSMDAQALAATQQEVAASIATTLVRPLILTLGKDSQWFFRDLPEEAVQTIIDAAATAAQ